MNTFTRQIVADLEAQERERISANFLAALRFELGDDHPLAQPDALNADTVARLARDRVQRWRQEAVEAEAAALREELNALRADGIPRLKVRRVSRRKHLLLWAGGDGLPIAPAMGDFLIDIGKHGEAQGNRDKVPALAKLLARHFPALADVFASANKRARRKMLTWQAPKLRGRVSEE